MWTRTPDEIALVRCCSLQQLLGCGCNHLKVTTRHSSRQSVTHASVAVRSYAGGPSTVASMSLSAFPTCVCVCACKQSITHSTKIKESMVKCRLRDICASLQNATPLRTWESRDHPNQGHIQTEGTSKIRGNIPTQGPSKSRELPKLGNIQIEGPPLSIYAYA